MNLIGMDRPWEFDELPKSMWPAKSTPMNQYNPDEAVALAERPQKVLEVPKDVSEAHQRKLRGLAQYRGRSREGQINSLGNLRRSIKTMSDDIKQRELPEGMPVPTKVALDLPTCPAATAMKGKALKVIMTKEELNLYLEHWEQWMTAHGAEYNQIEDEMDVHHVCMEAVIQYRINLNMVRHPNKDFTNAYNQSFLRQQQARKNLDATRAARLDRKAGKGLPGNTTFNVAIMAGQAHKMLEQRKAQALTNQAEVDDFLEGTVVRSQELAKAEEESEK